MFYNSVSLFLQYLYIKGYSAVQTTKGNETRLWQPSGRRSKIWIENVSLGSVDGRK